MNTFEIAGRKIGPGHPCYIIAELSANHGQNIENALALVKVAKDAGADAIKLQTYRADTITIDCDNEYFTIKKGTAWEGQRLYDLYEEAHTPWEWHQTIFEEAAKYGLHCFSSPFDDSAVDFLESINSPAYKIASFEIVDHGLIAKCAKTGKPMIMSTGMASKEEVAEAVKVARDNGCKQLALLKCVSSYPAPADEMHLATIQDLSQSFDCPAGLSDHTLGITIPVAAASIGATIIEKHFTLRRADGGPDSHFSLEPHEFKEMVSSVRAAQSAVSTPSYELTSSQVASRAFRRSLFAVKNIKAGEALTKENVRSIRPGYGLAPKHLTEVMTKTANTDIAYGTPLSWEQLS
ncbi:MAG: pseudaminic acid synthase [Rubritalea sp.]|jgi:pseudaminic acid synthase|tara:strand:- start:681 stop:1730 length:1050 start_codon:yes stop_codon:yes gene_type:complete